MSVCTCVCVFKAAIIDWSRGSVCMPLAWGLRESLRNSRSIHSPALFPGAGSFHPQGGVSFSSLPSRRSNGRASHQWCTHAFSLYIYKKPNFRCRCLFLLNSSLFCTAGTMSLPLPLSASLLTWAHFLSLHLIVFGLHTLSIRLSKSPSCSCLFLSFISSLFLSVNHLICPAKSY